MTTTIEKNQVITTIKKSFTTKTKLGFDILITAYRRVINVTEVSFQSKTYFSVSFNGENYGYNDMDKIGLLDAISTINKWGNKK